MKFQIRIDDDTDKDLDYLSKILGLDRSKTIRWLIQVMARAFRDRTEVGGMTLEEASELWNSNKYHYQDEVIEGFPTGNCYVGFTLEDFNKLCEFFSEEKLESKEVE